MAPPLQEGQPQGLPLQEKGVHVGTPLQGVGMDNQTKYIDRLMQMPKEKLILGCIDGEIRWRDFVDVIEYQRRTIKGLNDLVFRCEEERTRREGRIDWLESRIEELEAEADPVGLWKVRDGGRIADLERMLDDAIDERDAIKAKLEGAV